jgi:hypothetical protein
MISAIQEKSLDMLSSVVKTLESYDDVANRQPVFATDCHHKKPQEEKTLIPGGKDGAQIYEVTHDDDDQEVETLAPGERFKHLTFELIDIGIYGG